MLPMTVLRRLDCVLEPTKDKVLQRVESLKGGPVKDSELILNRAAGQQFQTNPKLFQVEFDSPSCLYGIIDI